MRKQFFKQMSRKRLADVIEKNSKLKYEIIDKLLKYASHWVNNYINPIKEDLIRWNIDTYNSTIKVNPERYQPFLEGCKVLQEMYCFFGEEANAKIEEGLKAWCDDDDEKLERIINMLSVAFAETCESEYQNAYDMSNIIQYLADGIYEGAYDNYYTLDRTTMVAYREIVECLQ